MIDSLQRFFSADGFMPHGHCYLWRADLLWLHLTSDTLVTLAYFSIPFTLLYFVRKRRDLQFNWMFVCFAVFIVACGATHLMEIWTVWHPTYWLSGTVKAITALASVPTAILLVRLVPDALKIPSVSSLHQANLRLAQEVTERKNAEEEVRQLNAQLERRVAERTQALERAYDDLRQTQQFLMQQERLRAFGQMASGVAHDVNNALTPASLYLEAILGRDPSLSPQSREQLQVVQNALDDIAHTVARMREFYRRRDTQLALEPVHLNAISEHVIELTRVRWRDIPQERGIVIQLEKDLESDVPAIMGVASEIRDALTNVVLNAIDAMPEGGTLTIATRVPRNGASQETGAADAGSTQVEVHISDTGIGMDEDTCARCLEPFFSTKGECGTGLGLAMVYGMVQRHNGTLQIQSAPGEGTCVQIVFPLLAAASHVDTASASTQRPAYGLRVLVVDDDSVLLRSLEHALRADGHTVEVAEGGQPGIEAFRAAARSGAAFDVVITDLGMPYVNGRRVAAAIKAVSATTPVIMLTGWGYRLLAEGDVPEHVDRVLTKPPKLAELRMVLAELTATGNIANSMTGAE